MVRNKVYFIPVAVGDFPLGRTESSYPETFHVQNGARINDETTVITLRYGSQLVSEEDRRWFLHCKISFKVVK